MADNEDEGFFANILKPGSALQPQFLAVLDGAFATLLVILFALVFLTSGNLHIFVLIAIELGLWASVKWYTMHLSKLPRYNTLKVQ
ncbi:hypothetical protein MIND_00710900 [Mycena indigotica]|uniref:Uncharacterized protein n=1 Tax=Mycena indigotica TaxID=2126181 RepID=A0A8H6W3D7_9AGAR|nr:uncharacterized protein MIND_00710900 [Mycena indigotica]KAF7301456.1 hypothetical protein MIND_00710900 [Mycena indigotica]